MTNVHPFEEFRTNSELVKEWAKVLAKPITQTVLNLLRDNGPEFVKAPYGLTEIDVARRYGDVGGYARYHQLLADFGRMWPLRTGGLDEPSYEPPEETEPTN